MPSVFLSYSRTDFPLIEQLEAQLKDHPEISIWRDQEKIYGGQKWPKVLGEAIADQDVFLLAWSKHSAASHFVELEWNTAIALRKIIVPCLLDDTPLASSLRTFHGYRLNDATGLIQSVRGAPLADVQRREPVIRKLSDIAATDETTVLAQAKSIFAQQQWTVQGNVYQAGGDIHIHSEPSTPRAPEKTKPLIEKWQVWIMLIVGALTALSLAVDFPGKLGIHIFPNTERTGGDGQNRMLDQDLAGQVVDADTPNLEPLADVQVSLLGFARETTTDQNGVFRFDKVRAARETPIKFTLRKDCYEVETYEATLGNTGLRPPLSKSGACK
ncbi:MAG: TIR domain-containing protein [Nitrospira sp.]|nr:TIR domain-containing protein [Nitrospira sp.]